MRHVQEHGAHLLHRAPGARHSDLRFLRGRCGLSLREEAAQRQKAGTSTPGDAERKETLLIMITAEQFREAQRILLSRGNPEDPCGRCGCKRGTHLPPRTYSYAKTGASSGKSHEIPVQAPTCCECKFCFCFCVGFIEPFPNQPFRICVCDPKAKEITDDGTKEEFQLTA